MCLPINSRRSVAQPKMCPSNGAFDSSSRKTSSCLRNFGDLAGLDISIYVSVYVCIYVCIYPSIYRSIDRSIYRSIYLPTYIYICTCRCVCMCIYIYVYMPVYGKNLRNICSNRGLPKGTRQGKRKCGMSAQMMSS